jgi:outer membrane protein assembly factor BamB
MKAISKLLFLVALVICFSGCDNPPEDMTLRWQLPVAAEANFYPIAHGEHLIVPTRCGSYDCLEKLDPQTGQLHWSWVDSLGVIKGIYYNHTPYLTDNILVLANGKKLIGIDVDFGITAWVLEDSLPGASHLGGLGAICTRSYTKSDRKTSISRAFDCRSGKLVQSYELGSMDSVLLQLRSPDLYVSPSGDTLCLAGMAAYVPRGTTDSYVKIWSFGEKGVDAKIPILQDDIKGTCVTKQGLVSEDGLTYWIAGRTVLCVDPNNREIRWRRQLPRDMLSSHPYLVNNLLILACEDEVLYGLDRFTGQEVWTCPIAGTPSRVFANKGTLYLVGGSSQTLFCIDANNGSLQREYKSENGGFSRVFWAGQHTIVLQESGKWDAFSLPEAPLLPAAMPIY